MASRPGSRSQEAPRPLGSHLGDPDRARTLHRRPRLMLGVQEGREGWTQLSGAGSGGVLRRWIFHLPGDPEVSTHTHTPPPTGARQTGAAHGSHTHRGRGVADAPPKPSATRPAVRPPRRQGALWCSGASSARPGLGGSGLFTCALYASSLPASSLHSRSANMVGDSVSARYPVPSSSIRSSLAFPSLRGSFRAVCARGPVCLGAAGVRPGAASLADPIPTRLFPPGRAGLAPWLLSAEPVLCTHRVAFAPKP